MKPPVLLCYNLNGSKAAKIKFTAMRFKIRIREVGKDEYIQTLASLCGLEAPDEAVSPGEDFEDEMLVMAHFSDGLVGQFLQGCRAGKIPPVALKAVLTDVNSGWNAYALHRELLAEREAIAAQHKPAHSSGSREG